jgi:nucleotide-binding universal stress UspA family protein
MKKIVLAFDGDHFSQAMLDYAEHINSNRKALIVGAFVNGLYNYPIPVFYEGMVGMSLLKPDNTEENKIKEHIKTFEEYCTKQGMEYRVHHITEGNVMDELIYETRYADLMMVSGHSFLRLSYEKYVNESLQMFLEDIECPVLMVPDDFTPIKNVVLAYDSSPAAVKAIKNYGYSMTALSNLPTFLVKVVGEKEERNLSLVNRMEEYLSRHFPHLTLNVLKGKASTEIKEFIHAKEAPLLVIGSFGRGFLSQLLRKSLAHDIIVEHKLPVFIYH